MVQLRSIELNVPEAAKARDFFLNIWGLAPCLESGVDGSYYLRGSGDFPYLVALTEAPDPGVGSVTFEVTAGELENIHRAVTAVGLPSQNLVSHDPGGGQGLCVQLPEGEVFRFLTGCARTTLLSGRDLPRKLTHVVMNSANAETTADLCEAAFGFKVSDRTRGMVFVRCNASHHSLAFARAGFPSLNHIAFEMEDIDAVMRGIGRLRDHDIAPAWGPGRHGPGANVYAYYIAPFGAVVEFSTAVEVVDDSYPTGTPDDWTWPPNRIDQWGISNKDVAALSVAEKRFRFSPLSHFLAPTLSISQGNS